MFHSLTARLTSVVPLAVAFVVFGACADAPTEVAPDAAALAMSRATANKPVQLEFAKCLADPENFVWHGTVTGDVQGGLTTVLTDLRIAGPIWHVRFDWIVSAGDQSFVADLNGILNTRTGAVVMSGRATEEFDYLAGAQVQERGQLVDPENSCFEGTIRVLPATAR